MAKKKKNQNKTEQIDSRIKPSLGREITIAVITSLLSAAVIALFAFTEPRLVSADEKPEPPILNMKQEDGKDRLHVTISPKFRNTHLRSGYIENVRVFPVGLDTYPDEVKDVKVFKEEIAFLQEKEVRCEFIIVIDPQKNGLRLNLASSLSGPLTKTVNRTSKRSRFGDHRLEILGHNRRKKRRAPRGEMTSADVFPIPGDGLWIWNPLRCRNLLNPFLFWTCFAQACPYPPRCRGCCDGFTDLDGSQLDCWRYIRQIQEAGKSADATMYR